MDLFEPISSELVDLYIFVNLAREIVCNVNLRYDMASASFFSSSS